MWCFSKSLCKPCGSTWWNHVGLFCCLQYRTNTTLISIVWSVLSGKIQIAGKQDRCYRKPHKNTHAGNVGVSIKRLGSRTAAIGWCQIGGIWRNCSRALGSANWMRLISRKNHHAVCAFWWPLISQWSLKSLSRLKQVRPSHQLHLFAVKWWLVLLPVWRWFAPQCELALP